MKLILHIGMGKTGTSSIQQALASYSESLSRDGAFYLGMWFDRISPEYRGLANQMKFFSLDEKRIREAANKFLGELNSLALETNASKFILSNEAMSGQSRALDPFLQEVSRYIQVSVVCYVRDPVNWLPTAFAQWGMIDKIWPGPVRSFRDAAGLLAQWYQGPLDWAKLKNCEFIIGHYDPVPDIVSDFFQVAGLTPPAENIRAYAKLDDADLVMRAVFNSQIPSAVGPKKYESCVLSKSDVCASLIDLKGKWLDYSSVYEIINEKLELFTRYKTEFAIDLISDRKDSFHSVETCSLYEQVIDRLLQITMKQALQLEALEQRIRSIEAGLV